jgi:hypothetical protein
LGFNHVFVAGWHHVSKLLEEIVGSIIVLVGTSYLDTGETPADTVNKNPFG